MQLSPSRPRLSGSAGSSLSGAVSDGCPRRLAVVPAVRQRARARGRSRALPRLRLDLLRKLCARGRGSPRARRQGAARQAADRAATRLLGSAGRLPRGKRGAARRAPARVPRGDRARGRAGRVARHPPRALRRPLRPRPHLARPRRRGAAAPATTWASSHSSARTSCPPKWRSRTRTRYCATGPGGKSTRSAAGSIASSIGVERTTRSPSIAARTRLRCASTAARLAVRSSPPGV